MDLYKIRNEILEILEAKRNELNLSFEEENHIYTMSNLIENRSDWPSVSKVLKKFYTPFPTDEAATNKSRGNIVIKEQLIKEWENEGVRSANMGSRVHYILEGKCLNKFNIVKDIRKPIFDCDDEQVIKSDKMISNGVMFINKCQEHGMVLLDTEMVLGSNILGYVGQPDKVFLYKTKNDELSFIVTDWKSNKKKNFETTKWTKSMNEPFEYLPNIALSHYKLQLPFYARLLKDMLKGSKYEDILLHSCVIVHLSEDSYKTYKVSNDTIGEVFNLDLTKYIK